MWHRHGGLVVTTEDPGLRVEDQDWSELTLDAFPSTSDETTVRYIYERNSNKYQSLKMDSHSVGLQLALGSSSAPRSFRLRVHYAHGMAPSTVFIDGVEAPFTIFKAAPGGTVAWPFSGVGSRPAAGVIAEVYIPASAKPRNIQVSL